MDGVSVSSALGRIDLKLAASVGTEVVRVSGIGPHGVDRGISVVGTLGATATTNQSELSQKTKRYAMCKRTTPELEPTGASKLSPR